MPDPIQAAAERYQEQYLAKIVDEKHLETGCKLTAYPNHYEGLIDDRFALVPQLLAALKAAREEIIELIGCSYHSYEACQKAIAENRVIKEIDAAIAAGEGR